MKVLIVQPKSNFYGGAERVIVKMCQYMAKHGIVHTLSMPCVTPQMRSDLPKETRYISMLNADLMRQHDIVNFHNFPATLNALYCPRPSVYMLNEPAELFTNWKRKPIEVINRYLIRHNIRNVVVADKFNAARCFNLYNVIPKVIPYGIDYDFFSDCNHRPDREYFTVMQVGTISRYKNQLATIKAVADVRVRIPKIRLWLVGNVSEPDYKEEVHAAIHDYGLAGCVHWEPHLTREHLRMLYSQADVLLHPVKEQGGWLSPFEAISAGCPVIVSKELTCADMVKDNSLADVSNDYAQSLISAFRYRGVDVARINNRRCQKWVKDNLSWDKFSASMVANFEGVLGN